MASPADDNDDDRDPEDPDLSDQDPDYDDGATETVDCPHCGKSIYEGSDFCHHCGKAVSADEIASNRSVLFMIGMVLCVLVMAAFVIGYLVAAFR